MAGKDDEMFMTRSFNVTPKTTEQHLIARSGKSEAYVTNNKRLCSTLKLTTDEHEASRGLFATANLLVTDHRYLRQTVVSVDFRMGKSQIKSRIIFSAHKICCKTNIKYKCNVSQDGRKNSRVTRCECHITIVMQRN